LLLLIPFRRRSVGKTIETNLQSSFRVNIGGKKETSLNQQGRAGQGRAGQGRTGQPIILFSLNGYIISNKTFANNNQVWLVLWPGKLGNSAEGFVLRFAVEFIPKGLQWD
jgi:hypothetical protein